MQVLTERGAITAEDLFIEILEDDCDKKYVHILGYVYGCDDEEKPYRGVEYTNFYASIEDVSHGKIFDYEMEHEEDIKQYIVEMTEKEAEKYIKHYYAGEPPILIGAKYIDNSINCGGYAVKFNK